MLEGQNVAFRVTLFSIHTLMFGKPVTMRWKVFCEDVP